MINYFKTHLYFKRKSVISKKASIYWFSKITNSTINDYSYLGPFCDINNCEIGKFSSLANNVKIGMGLHPTNLISTSPIFYSPKNPLMKVFVHKKFFIEYKKVKIGHDVWIGSSAIIMDGVTIGDGAIIGANAVVTKDIPDYAIAVGVPAKVIKYRFREEQIEKIKVMKWWNWDIEKIQENLDIFTKPIE